MPRKKKQRPSPPCERTLAENIAVLCVVSNQLPVIPHSNQLPVAEEGHVTRSLALEQECALTRTLAFIAGSVSDESKYVMAACIEEDPVHNGIIVRLAINKLARISETAALSKAREGLEIIFRILERFQSGITGHPLTL
jgi:hypothetical protein